MCGVAGTITLGADLNQNDFDTVKNMTTRLIHRGPDQYDCFHNKRASVGNTRLAIIDLNQRSRLPMPNSDETIWISYNGEVSNFLELKREHCLEEKYQFRGRSDTEVVLRLYEEYGIECLKMLSGMFAFSIIDFKKNVAFIVRDFFGINPMFYSIQNEKIYFSSEIKGLLEIPNQKLDINNTAMFHYMTLAYIPGKDTPYDQFTELRGGELIEINLNTGKYDIRKYYDVNNVLYKTNQHITEKEAANNVHDLMLDSVRRNLISDAPIGTTLSGGVDTSTMVGLIKELGKSKDFHTLSIKMGSTTWDESPYQRLVSDFAETNHHEILVTPEDVLENLIEHVAYLDEPTGDGAAIPAYILSREAKKYVSVLLSGEGGDEIFNAYSIYGAYKVRKMYVNYTPKLIRKMIYNCAHLMPTSYNKLSLDFQMKRFTEGSNLDAPAAQIYWRHVLTDEEKSKVINNADSYEETANIMRRLFKNNNYTEELNKISLLDVEHFFIDDLMVKNDRMFMAHSVETRFPYMDRFVVEYATSIPANLRMKGLKRRNIQKKAMKGLLPPQILRRSNFGLEMPHSVWFLNAFKPVIEKYFNKQNVERSGFFKWEWVEEIWKTHLAGKKDYGRAIWSILIYLIWFDLYIYNGDYKKYHRQN